MKLCGVLFTTLLACCVAVENFNPAVPLVHRLSSRIKRQSTGGDPNLEGIFGAQNNNNGQFGQSSSSGSGTSNEQPQFGFGFSGLGETQSNNNNNNNNNGGFGSFDNSGSSNPNQGSNNNGGFNNQESFGNNGGFGNNQGSSGSGSNAQNVQRPQTTQRTPLNQIALQTTISSTDCLRNCRNRLPQQYSPVCGSDNISYLNTQVFDCYKRECRQDVKVVYAGSCVTTRAPQ